MRYIRTGTGQREATEAAVGGAVRAGPWATAKIGPDIHARVEKVNGPSYRSNRAPERMVPTGFTNSK